MPDQLETFLAAHFSRVDNHDPYGEEALRDYLKLGALHRFIPPELGGTYRNALDVMEFMELTSYYSLPLGLSMGISGSLFLRPVVLHAQAPLRERIVSQFLAGPTLGGLMLTEPSGGTDVSAFRTSYTERGDALSLTGTKCWGGLTGRAEHWLVAARLRRGEKLTSRMALIYVPFASNGVAVRKRFDALGLQPIPYGETHFTDTEVPLANIVALRGESPARAIYDTLFRSRLGLPAISAGHCKRMADESARRAESRIVGGSPLAHYDQTQFRLSDLRGMYEATHALGRFTGAWMDSHEDVTGENTLANASKIICTETMHMASDAALQLFASAAYKRNHVVGRGYVDSRPFRIFEGVNEVLDESIYDVINRRAGSCDADAVTQELARYGVSPASAAAGEALERFRTPAGTQRQRVALGRIIAWLLCLGIVENAPMESEDRRRDALLLVSRKIAETAAVVPYLG